MLTHYYCLLAMWLGTFYHWGILILHPLLGDGYTLSSFQSSILVALSVLPAWLLANHDFIKPIQVTNLYKVQEYCPSAYYQHYEEGLSMGRIVRCMGFSSRVWLGGTGFSGWQGWWYSLEKGLSPACQGLTTGRFKLLMNNTQESNILTIRWGWN